MISLLGNDILHKGRLTRHLRSLRVVLTLIKDTVLVSVFTDEGGEDYTHTGGGSLHTD